MLTAKQIKDIFFHRSDVFAVQQAKGMYFPEKRPVTIEDIEKHIRGEWTIGAYCLQLDNSVKWACVDIDLHENCPVCRAKGNSDGEGIWSCSECPHAWFGKSLKDLEEESKTIYSLFSGYPRMREFSGRRGHHVWIFFKKPVQASFAQKLVKARLNRIGMNKHEVFPKQVELNESRKYGNLVKVPLATHRVSGKKSVILEMEGLI